MFCVMSFKVLVMCCYFTTTIFGHLVPTDSTRKHFQFDLNKNIFRDYSSSLINLFSEKSDCKAIDTEIAYPFARRNESVVDDLHGIKVNIFHST